MENDLVIAELPTKYGDFRFGVWNHKKGEEVVFLATPTLNITLPVLVRVHSECMTGDVFGSLRCDCGEQKERSLEMITKSGNGVFIYLRQEGRGIGLFEKIRAYVLQQEGHDTHEANLLLGHLPDQREYSWVKNVLEYLGVKEIQLITNNPTKVDEIEQFGIIINKRIPLVTKSNPHNKKYLETKRSKFKHYFTTEQ